MENLKIVEYTPDYARAVAEMWQKSTEGWNGGNGNETEKSVLATHVASTDINTYLAVLGEEVLGYCRFTRYREDEGALYIRTLNARYDFHGKGIGKVLVKKSIERTIELKWPRLDLYTWAANTKSIPLYKKCGFFLENREDTTHLMNFIPTVMQTDAVKNYFENADWYDDMKKTIDIEPDGREENGFDFYEYFWEKDGKQLRMEFERKGRGLRLIETDDYMISLSVHSQNLVFGKSYKAVYEIINKAGKPLTVEIKGMDDKNIKYSVNKKIEVVEKEIVEGEFYLSEIEEEFGKFKTHPGVVAELVINGTKALFKLGIVPKFPAKTSLSCEELERYSGESMNLYIDIESNLDESGIFEFELPESKDIDFSERKYKIQMTKNQKLSIPVQCILKKPSIYQAELNITAVLASGEGIKFKKDIAAIFRGYSYSFGGEIDGKYVIVNGVYTLTLNKNDNEVEVFGEAKEAKTNFFCPRLGKPYSQEFNSMLVQNVKWYQEDESIVLSGEYASNDFKNIIVKSIFKMANNGIIQHSYEVCNTSKDETPNEIYINQSFVYELTGAAIPFEDKILQITEPGLESLEYFDCRKVNENWIFAGSGRETKSLIWPKDLNLGFDSWFMYLEHSMGRLKGGERKATQPVYLAINTFKSWNEVRRFALKSNALKDKCSSFDFEIDVNNKNPFVNESFNINIIENRNLSCNGEIIVKSKKDFFDNVHIKLQDKENSINIPIHSEKGFGDDIISIESNFNSMNFEQKIPVFYVKNMEFMSQVTEEEGMKVYSIGNGVMDIKASSKFSTGIFSLQFMNREWLESSYPIAGPRTWFNPWFGGIQTLPEMMVFNGRSLLKEHIEVEFAEKIDGLGNTWKGIKTRMCIMHNEDYKGLEINQYFLMLPGIPVILHFTELINNMGKYMDNCEFMDSAFFKMNEEIKSNWTSVKNRQGGITKYRAGVEAYDILTNSSFLYGSDSLEYKIQVYTDFNKCNQWGFLNTKDFARMNSRHDSLASGERRFLPNVFYIFTKEHISDKLLKNLKNISFE